MRRLLLSMLALVTVPGPILAAPPSDQPLPPREAALAMTVPSGFKVTLFAGEPDVVQPMAFAFDDRGRLWVAECVSYPNWIKDGSPGKDRILVFEDTDNDGQFDKRTVFLDNLPNLTSIEIGFGGVFALCAPNLLFIPFVNGTDQAGKAEILLDGWNLDVRHNIVNGLKWGPDGWLYGCHGIIATSYVGRPDTPKEQRPAINCGVWRYHPTKKLYEVFASGTTNPWGLDWDEFGEMFITNCVIDHAFHVVPGGHYQRMYGQDLNAHAYELMKSCVDHIHWAGGHWTSSRGGAGKHSDAGGGHAHSGCMIYLGDNFPASYRNGLFTCNIHGSRLNHDILEKTGGGYVARHGKDFLFANDPWFRGLAVHYGPDGGIFVADWCDTGECHNYQVAHKTSGRIYKVVYTAGPKIETPTDLQKWSDLQLATVNSKEARNEWKVRHARRILQERATQRKIDADAVAALKAQLDGPSENVRLRARWALYAIGAEDLACQIAAHHGEREHAWAFRLLLESCSDNARVDARFQELVSSGLGIKVHLAAGLQRIPQERRWSLAERLLAQTDGNQDRNYSLLLWYGVEALAGADPVKAVTLLAKCQNDLVRELLARRIASHTDGKKASAALDGLVSALVEHDRAPLHRDVLRGLQAAFEGRRSLPMPSAWAKAYPLLRQSPLPEVPDRAINLAVVFGDERALQYLRKLVTDSTATLTRRQDALRTLTFKQVPDLKAILVTLVKDDAMRAPAIQGLASFADDAIPPLLLQMYPRLRDEEKSDVVLTLSARPMFALALLDAVEKKLVERRDLSSYTIRQMGALNHSQVTRRVEEVWGSLRPASKEKARLLKKYKAMFSSENLKSANLANGRVVFAKECAVCHKLLGEGQAIGPELTGSQRNSLDYLLENLLDPSAVVPKEYQVAVVTTTSGRTITGIVKEESDRLIKVQTQNELIVLPRDDIENRALSKASMMPEGMLEKLTPNEARDLIAYLSSAGK